MHGIACFCGVSLTLWQEFEFALFVVAACTAPKSVILNEPKRWLWSRKISKIKTRPFDMANYLGSEEKVAEYLRQVREDGDPSELAAALGGIARARGMTQLGRDTGLSRESLYKSLSGERAPSSETLFKVIHAMGFKLTWQPIGARA